MFDYEAIPVLETARLRLRGLTLSDAAAVYVFRSDPEVQKYNAPPMANSMEAMTLIRDLQAGFKARRMIPWGLVRRDDPADTVIGLMGFNYWDEYHHRGAVGYDMARDWWGRGFGTEAVGELVRFGFKDMALHRIEAETIADNHESVGLLKKLGFQLEGIRREYSLEDDGVYHGSAIYGLLRGEWRGE